VSIARIAVVPFMVWLMVLPSQEAAWAATALFAAGAASDRLDGYLARRHGMVTPTGAWLDPLADKLFVIAPIVVMVAQERFPWWATAVIIVREAAVSLFRWRLDKRGLSLPASSAGKLKTVVQLVAIGAYLMPPIPGGLRLGLAVVAVGITVYSGVEYFVNGEKLEHLAKEEGAAT